MPGEKQAMTPVSMRKNIVSIISQSHSIARPFDTIIYGSRDFKLFILWKVCYYFSICVTRYYSER